MNAVKTDRKIFIFKILLLSALLYFPLFLHLERLPMKIWDEARLAVSACEMSLNGNYLVVYFDGSPEMWSTKPPLLIWIQTLMIKIMGVRELAIRLPSALAALFTALLMTYFSKKYLNSFWFGFISAILLVTSYGYVHHHGTRTGDYDSLLTLLMAAYSFAFFFFLERGKVKYIHIFFSLLTLAVLTKSIQAIIFLPGLAILALTYKGRIAELLKSKWFYIDFLLCIAGIAGYYLLREHYNPGYIKAVSENELGGRFLKSLEGHDKEFMYYYNNLVDVRFTDWYQLLITSLLIGFTVKDIRIKKLTIFCSITIISYWLIISSAKTKLEWYDLPLFPFLCLMSAITLYWIFTFIKENKSINQQFYFNVLPFIFLFLVFLKPYEKIIDKVYAPTEYEADYYRISFFLRQVIKDPDPNHTYDVCYDNFDKAHILFYVYMLNDKGKKSSIRDCRYLKSGDRVIAIQQHEKEYIEKFYAYDVLENYYNIKTYKIKQSLIVN